MRRMMHAWRWLVVLSVALVGGSCLPVNVAKNEKKVQLQDTWRQMSPVSAWKADAQLKGSKLFEDARIVVSVSERSICRKRRIENVRVDEVTTRTLEKSWTLFAAGIGSIVTGACAAVHATGNSCLSSTSGGGGEAGAVAGWAIGSIGGVGFIVGNLVKSRDSTETIERYEKPGEVQKKDCGIQPAPPGTEVVVHGPRDEKRLYKTVSQKGKITFRLTEFDIEAFQQGQAMGRLFIKDERVTTLPEFSAKLARQRRRRADNSTWSEVEKRQTAEGYLSYLQKFPKGRHVEEAHKTLVARLEETKETSLLERYLAFCKKHRVPETVDVPIDTLRSRYVELRAQEAFKAYRTSWKTSSPTSRGSGPLGEKMTASDVSAVAGMCGAGNTLVYRQDGTLQIKCQTCPKPVNQAWTGEHTPGEDAHLGIRQLHIGRFGADDALYAFVFGEGCWPWARAYSKPVVLLRRVKQQNWEVAHVPENQGHQVVRQCWQLQGPKSTSLVCKESITFTGETTINYSNYRSKGEEMKVETGIGQVRFIV